MPAPLGGSVAQFFDSSGNPLPGGKLYTYVAATSTPQATYTDSTLAVANANPVILDAAGRAAIWCPNTFNYKFILKDSSDVTIWTIDNVAPAQGYPNPYPSEWIPESGTITWINTTSFKIVGLDRTSVYAKGRVIKSLNSGVTVYSQVQSAAYAAGDTSIAVENFSNTLDNTISALNYGIISGQPTLSSLPPTSPNQTRISASSAAGGVMATGVDAILGLAATFPASSLQDSLGEFITGTGRFVPKITGNYRVTLNCRITFTGITFTAAGVVSKLLRNGATVNGGQVLHSAPIGPGGTTSGGSLSMVMPNLGPADYLQFAVNAAYSAGAPQPEWAFTIERVL